MVQRIEEVEDVTILLAKKIHVATYRTFVLFHVVHQEKTFILLKINFTPACFHYCASLSYQT